jgi:hypothetical protein
VPWRPTPLPGPRPEGPRPGGPLLTKRGAARVEAEHGRWGELQGGALGKVIAVGAHRGVGSSSRAEK